MLCMLATEAGSFLSRMEPPAQPPAVHSTAPSWGPAGECLAKLQAGRWAGQAQAQGSVKGQQLVRMQAPPGLALIARAGLWRGQYTAGFAAAHSRLMQSIQLLLPRGVVLQQNVDVCSLLLAAWGRWRAWQKEQWQERQ